MIEISIIAAIAAFAYLIERLTRPRHETIYQRVHPRYIVWRAARQTEETEE
jgi:hypothetical protein